MSCKQLPPITHPTHTILKAFYSILILIMSIAVIELIGSKKVTHLSGRPLVCLEGAHSEIRHTYEPAAGASAHPHEHAVRCIYDVRGRGFQEVSLLLLALYQHRRRAGLDVYMYVICVCVCVCIIQYMCASV